jgi:hypothetical protein
LPESVDVSALRPGSPASVQLEHSAIVYEEKPIYHLSGQSPLRFVCEVQITAKIFDPNTDKTLYRLNNTACPYIMPERSEGIEVVAAYDPAHDLLATYTGVRVDVGVTIWIRQGDRYEPILKLNTAAYRLEFRDNGQTLYARNANGWKVYAVADILHAVESGR